jgi:hypothetical protein
LIIAPSGKQAIGAEIGDQHLRCGDRRTVEVDVDVAVILLSQLHVHAFGHQVSRLHDQKLAASKIKGADILIPLYLGSDAVQFLQVEKADELRGQLGGPRFLSRRERRKE